MFRRQQYFFGFATLCAHTNCKERSNNVTCAFFNDGKPNLENIPSVIAVRTTISLRVIRASGWTLSTGDGASFMLPSDHVGRNFAFHETLDRFFSAAERDVADRQWEPEFCDSAFFQDHPAALLSDTALEHFCLRSMLMNFGDLSTLCATLRTCPSSLMLEDTTKIRTETAL